MKGRIAGVVLAGGQGSRMGPEPKVLMTLGELSLVERATRRLSAQVDRLCISSNLPGDLLGGTGCAVVPDTVPGYRGPLAGVCAAMEFFSSRHTGVEWVCSVAADTPWFPEDLVVRLVQACGQPSVRGIAVARSAARAHPVFALWSMATLPALREVVEAGSDMSVARFQSRFALAWADWQVGGMDPFFNLNTPADIERARAYLRECGDSGPDIR